MKSINCNQLNVNATYLIRGKVAFSRITRQTTDEERKKENEKRTYPQQVNYSNITIYNASIMAKNPLNPSIEEQYAAEHLYQSASHPGYNYSAMNKSPNLPAVGVLVGPNQYQEIKPEGELAQDLDVTLVMRVFKSNKVNNGVTLDRVLVNEPIQYFKGSSQAEIENSLAEFGITFNALPPEQTQNDADIAAAEAASYDPAAQTPQPQSSAPAAPTGNPFSSYPPAQQTTAVTENPTGNPFTQYSQPQAAQPAATGNPFTQYSQPQAAQPAATGNPFTQYSQPQAAQPAATGNPFTQYSQPQAAQPAAAGNPSDPNNQMQFDAGQRQY